MLKTTAVMELGWAELLNSKTANARERVDFLDTMLPRQARKFLLESRYVFRSPALGAFLRPGLQAAPTAQ